MPKAQAIPEGFHSITPHLVVKGAFKALEFYRQAFGAEVLECSSVPGQEDVILHATVTIEGSAVMLNDEMPDFGMFGPGDRTAVTIHIYTADVDEFYKRAVEAGCEVVMPLADMFWADRYGILKDPFGHRWSIGAHIEEVDPADMERRMNAEFSGESDGSTTK